MTAKPSIAVVDDNKPLRDFMERILPGRGYRVISHSSGEEFLAFYENNKGESPDIVTLDMEMPGRNGFVVLEAALEFSAFARTIFVSLSAHYGAADRQWLEAGGFSVVLGKPFDTATLLETFDLIMKSRDELILKRSQERMSQVVQEL